MKKQQIILIRIMSVITVIAVMTLMLIFGIGNGLFKNLIYKFNTGSNTVFKYDVSMYQLYYYKAMDIIFQVLYAVTLFTDIYAITAVLLRKKTAYIASYAAIISNIIMGIFVILSQLGERSSRVICLFASWFVKVESTDIQVVKVMPHRILVAVIIIVLAILTFFLLKSSHMSKIEAFNGGKTIIYVPVLYGAIYIMGIRQQLITVLCTKGSDYMQLVHMYITDYVFAGKWGFDLNYAWYVIITFIIVYLVQSIENNNTANTAKNKVKLHLAGVFITYGVVPLAAFIRAVIYYINPPRIFGYLTMDEAICDAVDKAFVLVLLQFFVDVTFISVSCVMILESRNMHKKILITYAVSIAVSILGILIANVVKSVSWMYMSGIIAGLVGLDGLLYAAYISRRHH